MDDYRKHLNAEFVSRIKKNPKYSLRAFSRDLELSCGFLSQVLSGNRALSESSGLGVARKLAWNAAKTDKFLHSIRMNQIKDPELKSFVTKDSLDSYDFKDLEIEKFEAVSNWIHFAILELTRVEGFKSDERWIAKRLGLTRLEVCDAITRLLSLDLLKRESGQIKLVQNAAVPDAPSTAIRKFHKAHLDNAAKAIENQPFNKRHLSGLTTAINPDQIPIAEEMIKKFRRKLMKVLETGEKKAVYHMAFQLFQLDSGG